MKKKSSTILFLVFNRPEVTKRVFGAIRQAKPSRLYVAADGPRHDVEGETEKVSLVREIATNVDWDCEVKTRFRERNLGCKIAISNAISWFFEQEEEGIILEDDCLPDQSFFQYCQELLERYRNDTRIMAISGGNYQQGRLVSNESYYYSKYNHCWGWASWRRAWAHYDLDMKYWAEYRDQGMLDAWADGSDAFKRYWTHTYNKVAAGEVDTWDYQWTFSCWVQNGLTCLPNKNLIKNIGFDDLATHTTSNVDWRSTLEADELKFPLVHPKFIARNISADIFSDKVCYGINDEFVKEVKRTNYDRLRNSRLAQGLWAMLHRT